MQIKARYLGQIARYTTIVLTAWENLSGDPVLISFNNIYIEGGGEKKNQITSPTTKMKNNPWVTSFSDAINQCKAGSKELTEETMAYLKHLTMPCKVKAWTKLRRAQMQPPKQLLGICTGVRTMVHQLPWKAIHPATEKTANTGLGSGLSTSSL